jgi:hypothetical protein
MASGNANTLCKELHLQVLHTIMIFKNVLLTDFILAKGGVCDDVLVIEVFSDKVPNLTLVDLPGIVHVPRENESPDLPKLSEGIYI